MMSTTMRTPLFRGLAPLALAVLAAVLLAGCGPAYPTPSAGASTDDAATAAQGAEDFRWRGRIAPGDEVEIKGVNGRVRAVPAEGAEVDVRATKRARRSDPADVRIDVVEHAGGVTICAVYPTPRGERPNECRPGEGGGSSVEDNDVKVRFTVEVPEDVAFAGRTVNGDVDVGELESDVAAHTVNGGVRIDRARRARAATVNGSITASLTAADWTDPAEFETVNGSITLELPEAVGAELRISTVNGSIESDFPMRIQGRIGPQRVQGTIGGGGPELTLRTVNGSIRLRQGAAATS